MALSSPILSTFDEDNLMKFWSTNEKNELEIQ